MGGTIDSHWEGKLDTAVTNERSVIPRFFQSLILYADVNFKEISMKDSRQLTPHDLTVLSEVVESAKEKKIIITHGTYTMPDTAKYLKAHLKRNDQTIILTGSMVPLDGFQSSSSDAGFNLGYAIAKVEDLPVGVYLCMNGRTFAPDEVAKSLSEGKFFSVFDKQQ